MKDMHFGVRMEVFLSCHYKDCGSSLDIFREGIPRQFRRHADVRARIVSVLLILPHRQSCSADAASRAPLSNTIRASPRWLKAHDDESAWEKL